DAQPQRQQAHELDQEQEQESGQDEAAGEAGEPEGGRERELQPRQEEERRPERAEGPVRGAGGAQGGPAEEEQWQQEKEQLVRRLRQLEEREQEARRGGAKASEQAAAPAGTPQREEDDPALAEGVRRAARHKEKWARTERRLQQAREASQGRQARQAGQRPGREQEEFGLDQTPPPSPPPSSSDSEDDGDDRGDAGPAAAGRPRAHAAPQQAPQHRSRGGIERLAQAPAKFTHDEQPPVDVEMWLGQVAFYLEVMEARADTDRRRRNLTLLLLDGSARNWWLRKPQAERDAVTSFELLRDAMLARFRPIAARDVAYAKAHRLRQREGQSAQQYFDALTEALAPLSEQECGRYVRANMFIN